MSQLCADPYKQGVAEFGCGKCAVCLSKRRYQWTGRLLLEQAIATRAHFLTLTFDEKHCPKDMSVRPRHLQLFWKKLRENTGEKIRYFAVGEYGDQTLRPHYHAALFGLPLLRHINPGDAHIFGLPACTCEICTSWGQGGVGIGDLTPASASYIAGYVTKRSTHRSSPEYQPGGALEGRHPEFARMSLRPGIGADATTTLAKAVTGGPRRDIESGDRDVPTSIRREKQLWPLGRYLRRKLRSAMDLSPNPNPDIHQRRVHELQGQLRVPGARAARESTRKQHAKNARARTNLTTSKKGIGL